MILGSLKLVFIPPHIHMGLGTLLSLASGDTSKLIAGRGFKGTCTLCLAFLVQ